MKIAAGDSALAVGQVNKVVGITSMVFKSTGRIPSVESSGRFRVEMLGACDLEWRALFQTQSTNYRTLESAATKRSSTWLIAKLGNYHCNNRVYSIGHGRWLSSDQAEATYNLNDYTFNSATSRTDPTGLAIVFPADGDNAEKFKQTMLRVAWFACLRISFEEFEKEEEDIDTGKPKKVKYYRTKIEETYDNCDKRPWITEGGVKYDKDGKETADSGPKVLRVGAEGYNKKSSYIDADCLCKCSPTLQAQFKELHGKSYRDIMLMGGNEKATYDSVLISLNGSQAPEPARKDRKKKHLPVDYPAFNEGAPCRDYDSIVYRFSHELYRAMNNSTPGGGEAKKHSDFPDGKDPVFDHDAKVRKELGAPTWDY